MIIRTAILGSLVLACFVVVPRTAGAGLVEDPPPPPIEDLEVTEIGFDFVWLQWTSPTDLKPSLGGLGTIETDVVEYDLRVDDGSVLTRYPTDPPLGHGSIEKLQVKGLTPGKAYLFSIRSMDDAVPGQWSDWSNVITATPGGDLVAPGKVTNLDVADATVSSLKLTWTAPADDGYGGDDPAAIYDLRYSKVAPIETDEQFLAATPVPGLIPSAPGTLEEVWIGDLEKGTKYYIALKTGDDRPDEERWSELSNSASGSTKTTTVIEEGSDGANCIGASGASPGAGTICLTALSVLLLFRPARAN